VKLIPVTFWLCTEATAVAGENVNPVWLGAIKYDPFERPEKVKLPDASVLVDALAAPDSVTVAAEPLTVPEMLYWFAIVDGWNTIST
jgi:hypothetical protein